MILQLFAQATTPPISDWQWFWEHFATPLGASISALAIYGAARAHISWNRHSVRAERLKDAARLHQQNLEKLYSEFATTATTYIRRRVEATQELMTLVYMPSPGTDSNKIANVEISNARNAQSAKYAQAKAKQDRVEQRLTKAYILLLLNDRDLDRRGLADDLYNRCLGLPISQDCSDASLALFADLRRAISSTGLSLERQCQRSSDLADSEGRYPDEVIDRSVFSTASTGYQMARPKSAAESAASWE